MGDLYELYPALLYRGRERPSLTLIWMCCKFCRHSARRIVPLRRFPTSSFDLFNCRASSLRFGWLDLESKLRQLAGNSMVALQFLLIFPLPPDKKSVSFRLTLGADDRTLTSDEVTRTRENVVEGIKAAGYDLRE